MTTSELRGLLNNNNTVTITLNGHMTLTKNDNGLSKVDEYRTSSDREYDTIDEAIKPMMTAIKSKGIENITVANWTMCDDGYERMTESAVNA